MNNITGHYCPIDYDQQFALVALTAIGQVCCRKASFLNKMVVPQAH